MIKVKNTIGITGNIATGKSVLRRMLANSGALELDADVIAHRMLYPEGPSFQPVVSAFGEQILTDQGEISHSSLAKIVFSNPDKLSLLESLVHPWVIRSIVLRSEASQYDMTGIEAIKLLESGLVELCEYIWVSHVSKTEQIRRLVQTRDMDEQTARKRIESQAPQSEKISQADVVISTDGTFQKTWQQVQQALNETNQINREGTQTQVNASGKWHIIPIGSLKPDEIEFFWDTHTSLPFATLYETLGTKNVISIAKEGLLSAVIIFETWNFSAKIDKIIPEGILKVFSEEIFQAIRTHCEMAQVEMIFLPDEIVQRNKLSPSTFGYSHRSDQALTYPGWQRAIDRLCSKKVKNIWQMIISQPLERTLPMDRAAHQC